MTEALANKKLRQVVNKNPPTPLAEATQAELRNEWRLFEASAEHVFPYLDQRVPQIDRQRFEAALNRLRTIFA